MFCDLPPVGNKVLYKRTNVTPAFNGYESFFVDSGTSALALACQAAKQNCASTHPEIIIPAYGCPDLASAVGYAGCKIVLVDVTSSSDASFDLTALYESINENTAAVVAVNFLGVRERLAKIKAILPKQVALIEDNAQWYPEVSGANSLIGDISISSFGRGKPASILGGGMMLISNAFNAMLLDKDERFFEREISSPKKVNPLIRRAKIFLYNRLLNPYLFFWLNRNPLLNVGATEYHRLERINAMDSVALSLLTSNINRYLSLNLNVQIQLDKVVSQCKRFSSPGLDSDGDEQQRRQKLLRYALVCDNEQLAEMLYNDMNTHGLGATKMYKLSLDEILSAANIQFITYKKIIHAKQFAVRLITLPVHEGVKSKYLDKIITKISQYDKKIC